ncbi:hypothetical protein PTSG_12796 [Salpingoeca rosetta]|uniref:Inhibitor of growth protein n=1 Tax=Salpingoeca rosetta (strain ATCC 50818 / BSB-021) TaxID=946362 RepID=F2UKQ5_SALR5|nr:uncharacterized protein PTSG_12796 [Salpingoeca rosetta]EGD77704.1 hypothetical protein PTSG_12796 [Salpingoeca rosetta]|eukprot:XP_004990180.1 hypothetical protein PTSG_12796 [Salpingoeca rosetta]
MMTTMYLDQLLDSMKALPAELQRSFRMIRELDEKMAQAKAELERDCAHFKENIASLSVQERETKLRDFRDRFAALKQTSVEKLHIAAQSYEAVEKHIQEVDSDLSAFEAEARQRKRTCVCTRARASVCTVYHSTRACVLSVDLRCRSSLTALTILLWVNCLAAATSEGTPVFHVQEPAGQYDLPVDPNEPTYCICNQVSYGEMIACDSNDKCPLEWFHFACVDLTERPKGKWFCPFCRVPGDFSKRREPFRSTGYEAEVLEVYRAFRERIAFRNRCICLLSPGCGAEHAALGAALPEAFPSPFRGGTTNDDCGSGLLLLCVLAAVVLCTCSAAASAADGATETSNAQRPNIIIVLTDDQDALLNSTMFMPKLKHHVIEQGITFAFGLANSPVCCPSRSSLLSGRYIHNHGAVNNSVAGNCYGEKWIQETEKDALAVHMNKAGYRSLYGGKYLNLYYGPSNPPGWTEWFGLYGNSRYYNYTIKDNDKTVKFGDKYDTDYLTDVLARRAVRFINESAAADEPFFLWLGTPSAHASFTPAPQYENTVTGIKAPRTPNYNKVYADRHRPVRDLSPMTDEQIRQSDEIYRKRLETLRSVDDLVGDIFDTLAATNQLSNTWFFFTGDHGFHLGQFAMGFDKRQLYDTDIRVPYFVRGPGAAANTTRYEPISHVDLAPTVIDIAADSGVPSNWDGRSYKQLLLDPHATWKADNVIQYFGEGKTTESCGANILQYQADNNTCWRVGSYIPAPCDGVNNTYTCIRRVSDDLSTNDIFCTFECFDDARRVVPCPANQAGGYGEYYDLRTDPWQTVNLALNISTAQRRAFIDQINALKHCKGQAECQRTLSWNN